MEEEFERNFTRLLDVSTKILEYTDLAQVVDRVRHHKTGNGPFLEHLIKYNTVWKKQRQEGDVARHMSFFRHAYLQHVAEILMGPDHDEWLRKGESFTIVLGAGTSKTSKLHDVRLTAIYKRALEISQDKKDEDTEESLGSQEILYPRVVMLYIYRLSATVAAEEHQAQMREYVTKLEVELGLKEGQTIAIKDTVQTGMGGMLGSLFDNLKTDPRVENMMKKVGGGKNPQAALNKLFTKEGRDKMGKTFTELTKVSNPDEAIDKVVGGLDSVIVGDGEGAAAAQSWSPFDE
jgi:hypothetical protein